MALTLNAGKPTRRDLWWIDPTKIIVTEEHRGRSRPPTEEQIVELAMSIFDYGQQQPCTCRRVQRDRVKLVAGFTRAAAGRLIKSGFTGTDGLKRHNEEFKLQCAIVDCNDAEAFRRNVIENAHRGETSPIDDAVNQRRLKEDQGMTDQDVAQLYRYKDTSKVQRLAQLLQLDNAIQDEIHFGRMPIDAGLTLLKMDPKKRKQAVKAATKASGKITASAIKAQVREEHLADKPDLKQDVETPPSFSAEDEGSYVRSDIKPQANGETDTPQSKPTVPLSLADVKHFFQDMEKETDPRMWEFAGTVLQWMRGEVSDKVMRASLDKLAEGPENGD
jgi:ParB-like chromosome segregation protein Spo0J